MKLAFVHYDWQARSGMARGYLSSAFLLHRALKAVPGLELEDVAAGGQAGAADVHLHYCPPHFFRPFHVKHNALFTMWEGFSLPPDMLAPLDAAQQRIVPSRFCEKVWSSHGFDADVVPLGLAREYLECDTSRRIFRGPGEGLRFLFVGSQSNRKAWSLVGPAWRQAFFGQRNAHQCYVKMIGDGTVTRSGPIVVDQRDLEPRAMLELYRSADVFVSPTLIEGFGLPLLEAMASGCLAVATQAGGNEAFFGPGRGVIIARSSLMEVDYGGARFKLPSPTPRDIAGGIALAAEDWGTPPAESARAEGIASARRFGWEASAETLLGALFPAESSARMPA